MLAADEVVPTIQRIITEREAVRDMVARNVTPETATFANVIQPWLEEEDRNQGVEAVVDMYRYGSPCQESRDAAEQATKLMSECTARLVLRKDLFRLVKAVADKDDAPDEESRKALRDILREYTNVGHGILSPEQIESLLDARKEIDRLCQKFNANIRDNAEGEWFTTAELEGVPSTEIQRFTPDGKNEAYIDFGKRADRLVVLRHANNSATRKKLYLSNEHKLSENVALFKRVVCLRHENAQLLGFKNHFEFSLQRRIAPSVAWVDDMLKQMRRQLLPLGRGVMKQLEAIKRRHLLGGAGQGSDEILPWDFHYYMRMLEEERQVDQDLVSEYFPLHSTILGMLRLFGSFLQLRFMPLAPEQLLGHTWHADVEAWSVWDERRDHKGEFIGYLLSDVLHRAGKYKGNQNVNLQAVSTIQTERITEN